MAVAVPESERLGSEGAGGTPALRAHAWWHGFDWDGLEARRLQHSAPGMEGVGAGPVSPVSPMTPMAPAWSRGNQCTSPSLEPSGGGGYQRFGPFVDMYLPPVPEF